MAPKEELTAASILYRGKKVRRDAELNTTSLALQIQKYAESKNEKEAGKLGDEARRKVMTTYLSAAIMEQYQLCKNQHGGQLDITQLDIIDHFCL